MIHYIITGSSDSPELSELENLANIVRSSFKHIKVKVIIKHPIEWPQYLTEICKIYGFKEKLNPICFTPEGILVGGTEEFKQMVQAKFDVENLPSDTLQSVNTDLNQRVAEEDYVKRHREDYLQEKLDKEFLSHTLKGHLVLESEMFSKMQLKQGNVFVKYSRYLAPKIKIQ